MEFTPLNIYLQQIYSFSPCHTQKGWDIKAVNTFRLFIVLCIDDLSCPFTAIAESSSRKLEPRIVSPYRTANHLSPFAVLGEVLAKNGNIRRVRLDS